MSVLEIKGGLHEMIAKVDDQELLLQIKDLLTDVITKNMQKTDFWDELSIHQQIELDDAVEASYDEKNLVNHEIVLNKYKQWLKK
jgi:hypothetical protein